MFVLNFKQIILSNLENLLPLQPLNLSFSLKIRQRTIQFTFHIIILKIRSCPRQAIPVLADLKSSVMVNIQP